MTAAGVLLHDSLRTYDSDRILNADDGCGRLPGLLAFDVIAATSLLVIALLFSSQLSLSPAATFVMIGVGGAILVVDTIAIIALAIYMKPLLYPEKAETYIVRRETHVTYP